MRGCGGRGCEWDMKNVLVGCEIMVSGNRERGSSCVVVGGGKEAGFGFCGRPGHVVGAWEPTCPSSRGAGWRGQGWGWGTSPAWC